MGKDLKINEKLSDDVEVRQKDLDIAIKIAQLLNSYCDDVEDVKEVLTITCDVLKIRLPAFQIYVEECRK